jgi:phosphoglycerate dehydrogenase-like enzyme
VKLLLRYQYDADRLHFLRERLGDTWRVEAMDHPDDREALSMAMADSDAVVSMSWRPEFPAPESLRLIQLPGAGFDAVDFEAVPGGAAVCNVYEHEIGIAEFLILALLEWEIRLCRKHALLRTGEWSGSFVTRSPLHGELHGKTVGFVGYGRIARETAKRLKAFGVRIVAATRSPSRGDSFVDRIEGMGALHEILHECDRVVVSCPLTEQTRGLVDAAALDALGPRGVILNVARGAVVDEDALYEACRDKRIAGAVIDTWYRYPRSGASHAWPSEHPFQDLDNVIMSPHASGWSAGLLDRRWSFIADNLKRLERGEPLENVLKAPGEAPSF